MVQSTHNTRAISLPLKLDQDIIVAKNKTDMFTIMPSSDRAARIKARRRNNDKEHMPNEDVSKKQPRKAAVDKVQEGDMESGQNVAFDCSFSNAELCQSEEMVFVIYSIQIVGLVFLCSLILTAWPQHNVILMPEYWYEPLLLSLIGSLPFDTFWWMMTSMMMLNTDVIRSWRDCCKLYLKKCFIYTLTYVSIYIIWVHVKQKRHPMPFLGLPFAYLPIPLTLLSFWFLFPPNLRI